VADEHQRFLDALSSPVRREILWLVWDRELPAGDIAAAFEVTAPTISQHLAVLREAGLVEMRVDGSFRRYRAVQEAFRGLEALLAHTGRWVVRGDRAPTDEVASHRELVVAVTVEVGHDPAPTFECFVDPDRYSRWLGVPVSIVDGRFACTMEWGTRVRGTYEVVAPPSLLAMSWDFEDDQVPVPGRARTAYLRIAPTGSGSRVEVQQFVGSDDEADFMRAAWGLVLGRLRDGIDGALA
jgi:DNA-binding transcriptional ArsR family regulator